MADQVQIAVAGSDALAPAAQAALKSALEGYGLRLLEEAANIEKRRRVTPGAAMITDTTVQIVDMNARNGQMPPPLTRAMKAYRVAEYTATAGAGACAGYITHWYAAVGFAICVVLGVLFHLAGNRNG